MVRRGRRFESVRGLREVPALQLLLFANGTTAARPTTTSHAPSPKGKTIHDAVRSLKRYLARSLYRLLEHGPLLAT
jgi:hypothetical protein